MSDPSALLDRFEANAEFVLRVFGQIPEERLKEERVPGKWSAHGNLAHLAQFHDVIRDRFEAILTQDHPVFGRFDPDADPETARWLAMSSADVLSGFVTQRRELAAWMRTLTPEQWARTGTHGVLGHAPLIQWLEFYLIHEGHHLFTAVVRARV